MKFTDDFLDRIAARNDIVDVVGEYVRFTKHSGPNRFGLCPFHNEKTGSFSVNSSKQIYYCFGCHKGGGVINFIMEIENLRFPEAVEFLAKRAGIPMPEFEDDPAGKLRSRLKLLNKAAARYWYGMLVSDKGEPARQYTAKRRISPKTVTSFGLGYAPDSWDSLRSAMHAQGFTDREMFEAGLIKRSQKGSFYDAFRNRLVFPVIDVRGDVIGFSGRILGDGEPKYYNSPETAVFKKGLNLFALNLAKKSKAPYFILCEGNVDVVSLHQAGFDNAIASLGTALTPEQAKLISNFKSEVVIAYDSDAAGRKATDKAIGIFRKCGVKVRILRMRDAKDPDEFIGKFGSAAFQNLLSESGNDMDYQIDTLLERFNISIAEDKLGFLNEAAALIARNPNAVAREIYAGRVSDITGVSKEAVLKEIDSTRRKLIRQAQNRETRQDMTVSVTAAGSERFSVPESAIAEAGIIRLLLLDPELIKRSDLPAPEEFTSDAYRHIYSVVIGRLQDGRNTSNAALAQDLSPDEFSMLVDLGQKPEASSAADTAMGDYIRKLHRKKASSLSLEEALAQARATKT